MRDSCGKWFACFVVETAKEILAPTNNAVGIDLGLTHFAVFSDGEKINNPRFLKTDEKISKFLEVLISEFSTLQMSVGTMSR